MNSTLKLISHVFSGIEVSIVMLPTPEQQQFVEYTGSLLITLQLCFAEHQL